tara:strand:- start:126 stop:743 length:618 start_codon:yes stop_codon:yes gene_type:complete
MNLKYLIKNLTIFQLYINLKDSVNWIRRNFQPPSPPFVKHKIIKNHLITNSIFIETGTLIGDTILKLSKNFNKCVTIEPSKKFYEISKRRFIKLKNVEIINGTSEDSLEGVLKNIKKQNVTIYLDAHDSGMGTFSGNKLTPIIQELNLIKNYKKNFENCVIIIDDVRDFKENSGYPKIEYLFNFALENEMTINIEHDMFIMKSIN